MAQKSRKRATEKIFKLDLGANILANGFVSFRVWAPFVERVDVQLIKDDKVLKPLMNEGNGYFSAILENVDPHTSYMYVLDGTKERPDPVSRLLPNGVHGPTAIVDTKFNWTDKNWKGIAKENSIFYEIHTGTFTEDGTFGGIAKRLPYLKKLGITCIELMPVAQFPGDRNWGYDGASLFAVQNSYGGPQALKKMVNECHRNGIAVCLDVVYNHFGPEGNYLHDFGPYFTSKYKTPWGWAINYDDAYSDDVRHFICANAAYWFTEYHIDCLRLDAVHAIYDFSAKHILAELAERRQQLETQLNRKIYLIAESDLNDVRVVKKQELGGFGIDAQWSDDLHHALHVALTHEDQGYYEDYEGVSDLAAAVRNSFIYDGRYSKHRKRVHGNSAQGISPHSFVVCSQNHDQVGNRAKGDRLTEHLSHEQRKLAASIVLLSPYIPLLFMGEEYGETSPFPYFVDHQDPDLIKAVREGRRREFEAFKWKDVPDPKACQTFLSAKLKWELDEGEHKELLEAYRELIRIRNRFQKYIMSGWKHVFFDKDENIIKLQYPLKKRSLIGLFSFAETTFRIAIKDEHKFVEVFNTGLKKFGGPMKNCRIIKRGQELELFPYSASLGVSYAS